MAPLIEAGHRAGESESDEQTEQSEDSTLHRAEARAGFFSISCRLPQTHASPNLQECERANQQTRGEKRSITRWTHVFTDATAFA
jgi:hypothetical protein